MTKPRDPIHPIAIQVQDVEQSEKNVLGGELPLHCHSPKTGFYRDGYCRTGEADTGSHVIVAIVTDKFLEFTKSRGNDLQSRFKIVFQVTEKNQFFLRFQKEKSYFLQDYNIQH